MGPRSEQVADNRRRRTAESAGSAKLVVKRHNYTPWPWQQDVEAPWLAERRETLKVIPCDAPAGIAAAYGAGDGPGHVGRLAATARGRYALARSRRCWWLGGVATHCAGAATGNPSGRVFRFAPSIRWGHVAGSQGGAGERACR
jgi:hypothetical protein